ncbi:MAG: peptide-methionine (S)-S-oxide reductase MsrA [Leptospiraceae bacterium]|nr:peptide-methionine (S)-S-oxide reductase MsrA [Leptospiraceae bacterium]
MKFIIYFLVSISAIFSAEEKTAIFAGGCFWCNESLFEKVNGVIAVESGYTGGHKVNPSYEEVCTGNTGHFEAVKVTYDPKKISYKKLVEEFWKQIDPTDFDGQFADKGSQYRTAIFYNSDEEKKIALQSKEDLQKSKKYSFSKIATQVLKTSVFYPAEDYHQDYYKKNPNRYKQYFKGSGREDFLKKDLQTY